MTRMTARKESYLAFFGAFVGGKKFEQRDYETINFTHNQLPPSSLAPESY